MDLKKLQAPLNNRWRVQRHKTVRGADVVSMVAYVDSRDVQNVLDSVVGPGNWQDEYYQVGDNTYCRIGILVEDKWVWKSDAGAATKIESQKGLASDAFKRAAVKWGINRDAYNFDTLELPAKKYGKNWSPVTEKGEVLFGQALNDYCNSRAKMKVSVEEEEEKGANTLSDKRFEAALQALRSGKASKEAIMKFDLTEEQLKRLEDE